MQQLKKFLFQAAAFLAAFFCTTAHAQFGNLGYAELPQLDGGKTVLFYPTLAEENPVRQGPFEFSWAADGPPSFSNGRLVVISHGSGSSAWVHMDLTRALVRRGFTVAMPLHHGDNYKDASRPGPQSWAQRPLEISRAIDAVASYPPLQDLISTGRVGVFGGSAGGHTALTLAGGEWSPARFKTHCDQHMAEDFPACAGFSMRLQGNALDALKLWLARSVIAWRFSDPTPRRHTDTRIQAAVAMVPFAADFDPASLASPRIPLGLIITDQDKMLRPKFHAEAVAQACQPRCEILLRLADAGHGAMLSPMPPFAPGSIEFELLGDPPGFDRTTRTQQINQAVADFFAQHLLADR